MISLYIESPSHDFPDMHRFESDSVPEFVAMYGAAKAHPETVSIHVINWDTGFRLVKYDFKMEPKR